MGVPKNAQVVTGVQEGQEMRSSYQTLPCSISKDASYVQPECCRSCGEFGFCDRLRKRTCDRLKGEFDRRVGSGTLPIFLVVLLLSLKYDVELAAGGNN